MKAQRHLALCAAVYFLTMTGCVVSNSNGGSSNTASDTNAADVATSVDTSTDSGINPTDDVATVDTTTAVDTTVVEDTSTVEDTATPMDATTTEDAGVVEFGDGFTVPAPGLAACDNKDDIVLLSEGAEGLTETMKDCALKCLGEEECATDCVIKELGVTDDCAGCFGTNISCTMKNCALNCMDPNNPKCLECQEENCNDDFMDCAGITIPGS